MGQFKTAVAAIGVRSFPIRAERRSHAELDFESRPERAAAHTAAATFPAPQRHRDDAVHRLARLGLPVRPHAPRRCAAARRMVAAPGLIAPAALTDGLRAGLLAGTVQRSDPPGAIRQRASPARG
jgi:hypothetical protein